MVFAIFTDETKRFLISLIIIFILVFIIIGFLGALIGKLMKWQGKKIDTLCHDVVVTKVVSNKKHLKKYGKKKSWALFYKQSAVGLLLLALAFLTLLTRNLITKDWSYNLFDYEKEGFRTLFFIWDFGNPEYYTQVFGVPFKVLSVWPPLLNSPHLEIEAIASYIFLPLFLVGAIWYLVAIQALIARRIRLQKLIYQVFEKSLEGYNQTNGFMNNTNPQPTNNNDNK